LLALILLRPKGVSGEEITIDDQFISTQRNVQRDTDYIIDDLFLLGSQNIQPIKLGGLRVTEEEKEWVLNRIEEEGFDRERMNRIIMCESGWKPTAKHLNDNGTWDYGLFQINDVHGLSVEDRMDIYKSTEFAIKLLNSKRGFNHWVCFRQLST